MMSKSTVLNLCVIVMLAFPAMADMCADAPSVVWSSSDCVSEPSSDRIRGMHRMGDVFVASHGNELAIYSETGRSISRSRFNMPNQGDSDYDLMQVAMCDGCVYGAAWYKMGMVTFRVDGNRIGASEKHMGYTAGLGGFTYNVGMRQFLITNAWPSEECGSTAALWRFDGVSDLTLIECVRSPDRPIQVSGGIRHNSYAYLIEGSTRVHLVRLDASGVTYMAQMPWRATATNGRYTMAVEGNRLVTGGAAYNIIDIGNPVRMHTKIPDATSSIDLRDGWVIASSWEAGSEVACKLTDTDCKVFNAAWWASARPWNDYAWDSDSCLRTAAAVWGSDHMLHLARFSQYQLSDWSGCELPPTVFVDGFESRNTSAWQ